MPRPGMPRCRWRATMVPSCCASATTGAAPRRVSCDRRTACGECASVRCSSARRFASTPRRAVALRSSYGYREKTDDMPIPLVTRILVADDHTIVRRGLHQVLDREPDMEIVAEASDGAEAVRLALAGGVDLTLLDVSMPRLTGLQAAREI